MKIDTAFNLGQDAYKSLFVVTFDPAFGPFANLGLTRNDLMFRMTQFDVPSSAAGDEDIHWLTQKFKRNNGQVLEEKTIQLQSVRVDAGYKVLLAFYDWKDQAVNSYTGAVGDLTQLGMTTNFQVQPVSSQSLETGNITFRPGVGYFGFETCWCSDVSGVSFSMEDGGHLTFTPTLVFLRMRHNIGRSDDNYIARPTSYV